MYSSGTSTVSISYGSHFLPSISLITTCGLDTWNSIPSRRIVSIRMDRCSSPRPATLNVSAFSVSLTFSAISVSISLNRRAASLRDVTGSPSLPANGELFTIKLISRVGSSIFRNSIGSTLAGSQMVSPTLISPKPATATISPTAASSISNFFSPMKPYSLLMRACFTLPSRVCIATI